MMMHVYTYTYIYRLWEVCVESLIAVPSNGVSTSGNSRGSRHYRRHRWRTSVRALPFPLLYFSNNWVQN